MILANPEIAGFWQNLKSIIIHIIMYHIYLYFLLVCQLLGLPRKYFIKRIALLHRTYNLILLFVFSVSYTEPLMYGSVTNPVQVVNQ